MSADFIQTVSEIYSQRYSMQILKLIRQKIPCGFFTGFYADNEVSALVNTLKDVGFNLTCTCIIDDSQKNLFKDNVNTPFVTLDELPNSKFKPLKMLHFNGYRNSVFREYFLRFGIDTVVIGNEDYLDSLYNFYMQNMSQLYKAYEMLSDEESKKVFLAALKGNLTQLTGDFRFAPEPQYFLEGFLPNEGDIAIDGGAYDGATAKDFAIQGAKVYSFEMSEENYKNCLVLAEKYNFVMENMGLSNKVGEEYYTQNGAGSRKGGGNLVARFTNLDTYVEKNNLPRVDYIKLDIEGAELDMLHGAVKTISRWKPKMAISAYHKPEDLWTLAFYIKSIRPDYEFKFRQYAMMGLPFATASQIEILRHFGLSGVVPSPNEKVLYCR